MRDNQFEYASAMERLSYTTEQKAELARRGSARPPGHKEKFTAASRAGRCWWLRA